MALEPGFSVTPNVQLVEKLGEGGMGSVWIADHLTLHTKVAVKFVAEEAQTEVTLKRFSREASLAAQIKSPHVVQTYDHGATEDGVLYIVMERLEGESLKDRLERGPLRPRQVALLMAQTAKALTRAHDLGIIHRDLKPANMFMVDSGYEIFVKVLDFGIAKKTDDIGTGLTDSKALIGTPYYMSPESLRTTGKIDHRTDLWSLAVVAYHALTGRLPFEGETYGDHVVLVHEGRFTPPTEVVDGLSSLMNDFFLRAFNRDVEQRFQSATLLAKAFKSALGALPSDSGVDFAEDDMSPTASPPALGDSGAYDATLDSPMSTSTGETSGASTSLASDMNMNTVTMAGDSLDESMPLSERSSTMSSRTPSTGGIRASTFEGAATTFDGAPKSRRTLMIAAGAVAVVAIAGVAIGMSGDGPAPATPAEPSATAAATAEPTVAETAEPTAEPSAAAALPTAVAVTVDSVPARVEILQGNKSLGRAPGPVTLPYGDKGVPLTFKAPGHQDHELDVTPNRDQLIKVQLDKNVRRPPAGKRPSDQFEDW